MMNTNTSSASSSSSSSTNYSSSAATTIAAGTNKIGPRAKCDQVVYEAIAKAAEIIVRGRCHIDGHNSSKCNDNNNSNSNAGNPNGHGHDRRRTSFQKSSVSRFHLEVEEVDLVR